MFRFPQHFLVDHGAGLELVQVVEIDDRVMLLEGRVVEAALGQTPNQRHLAAFESESNAAAGARLLALVALAARLAVTGAFAACQVASRDGSNRDAV